MNILGVTKRKHIGPILGYQRPIGDFLNILFDALQGDPKIFWLLFDQIKTMNKIVIFFIKF